MDSPAPPPDTGSGLRTESVKRRRVLPKALAIGVVAGVLAGLFRVALQAAESWRSQIVLRPPAGAGLAFAVGIGALAGGCAVWLIRRFAPEGAGSGIPQLKSVVIGEERLDWQRLIPVKFLSGVIGIGGGFALGREGPTIQMGGASGLMVARWFRVPPGEGERKALICAGAGAGLAAAFNAPIAGMMFVLEELQVAFTPVVFVAAFLASAAAATVVRLIAGSEPVFAVRGMEAPTFAALPGALILGLIAGVAGVVFNRGLLKSLDLADHLRSWPSWALGAAVGALAGLAGWVVPGLAGTGTGLVREAIYGKIAAGGLLALMAVRFILTLASYACGTAGGIFIPMFVLGSLGGLAFGAVGHHVVPLWFPNPEIFAVLGMGALFTAIVRAPLTGLVLMVELTGVYDFMLPLLASCLVAFGVAEALGSTPIYEALRRRRRSKLASGALPPAQSGDEGDILGKTVH